MSKILIVRHGNSLSNIDKTFTGHIDSPLSELGEKQAQKLCDFLCNNFNVDVICSSDLSRAINTIKPLADKMGVKIRLDKNLREIYGGEWEGVKFSDIAQIYSSDFSVWKNTPGLARCTGGESYADATERIVSAVYKIAKENEGKTVVIATHGGVIRGLQCRLSGLTLKQMNEIDYVVNASVSVIEFIDDNLRWKGCLNCDYLSGLITEMPKGI